MAEEYHAAVCSGTWWMNTTKSMFGGCSSPIADVGSFGWGGATSTFEESIITSVSHGSGGGCNGRVLIDPTPITGFGLSQNGSSRIENYNSMVEEEIMIPKSVVMAKDWSPGDNISSTTDFLQEPLNSVTSAGNSPGFPPVCSASSILLQSLLEPDNHDHAEPQHQSFFNNQSMNYMSNFNDSSPCWSKASIPRQQPAVSAAVGSRNFHFSNNTQFWNASEAKPNFLPLSQPQFLTKFDQEKQNRLTLMTKINSDEIRDARAVMKRGSITRSEPAFKRPRIETPLPLPTFKVRKEKMGDRITALQQLVSPFGKTDTASVLQEAIEYIKFLHDQVSDLSTPYMKQGAPIQNQQDLEGSKQDLRSRGLCLVPVSSTFPVAKETTVDFWTQHL